MAGGDEVLSVLPTRADRLRGLLLRTAFGMLYRSRTLYWLASTLPFAGQWRVWQRRVLGRITGQDVLEVGCGIGSLFADLVSAGYQCSAIDASPQMVAATRHALRRRRLAARGAQVLQAQVQALPFADASFDTVISTFPTEYIYALRSVREIARVLRPGGRLIVVEGATLLPSGILMAPLALFQALVYGHPLARAPERGDSRTANAVWTEELPARSSAIPLEAAGLLRRSQRDWSRRWVVFLTLGLKPESAAGASDGPRDDVGPSEPTG